MNQNTDRRSKRKYIRRFAALLAAAALTVSLTGCSDRIQSLQSILHRQDAEESAAGSTAAAAEPGQTQDAAASATGAAAEVEPGAQAGAGNTSDDGTGAGALEEAGYGEGTVLNICCWDDTLEDLFLKYYPSYVDNGDGTGQLGKVKVQWLMSEDQDDYMKFLSDYLLKADYLGADERIDLFLASEDDLATYVSSTYSLDVRGTLGLTDAELEDQYPFTQQMAMDEDGILKAVSYKATPGVFVYRRSIAQSVLGTDDPEAVQKAVADWDSFVATAGEMKKKGYFMLSGYYDAYAPYRAGATKHWERGGVLQIDDVYPAWASFTKLMTDSGYHRKTFVGDDNWVSDQGPSGKVFGFFRSADDIDTRMAAYSLKNASMPPQEGNGIYGDFAICMGPQAFGRGGLWILAASGTDNATLDAEIMRKLTCDSGVLQEIAQGENIFTNTMSGMEALAAGERTDAFLGGQNAFKTYDYVCGRISAQSANAFDVRLSSAYRDSMLPYFQGDEDMEEATDDFYDYVDRIFPELSLGEED